MFCEFNEKIYAAGRKSEASEDEEKEIAAEKKIICESIRNEYEGSYGKAADGKNWFQEIVVDDVSRWLPLVMKMNSVGGTGFERRSWAFRGQGNSDWGLESSLGRLLHFDWLGIGKWACGFEKEAMWEFSREVKCKFEWRSFEGADMLALMQHYGCKTRLLDFSLSPLVALYMAHEQNEMDFRTGESYVRWLEKRTRCGAIENIRPAMSVWVVDMNRIMQNEAYQTVIKSLEAANELLNSKEDQIQVGKGICLVFPSICNDRVSAQDGIFLMPKSLGVSFEENLRASLPDAGAEYQTKFLTEASDFITANDFPPVVKFTFPKGTLCFVESLLQESGITPRKVYPDLTGLGRETAIRITERLKQWNQELHP